MASRSTPAFFAAPILKSFVVFSLFLAATLPAMAQDDVFFSGRDYEELRLPVDTGDQNRIRVSAFFRYDCADCLAVWQALSEWSLTKPDDTTIEWLPITSQSGSRRAARLMLALDRLGVHDAHQAFFQSPRMLQGNEQRVLQSIQQTLVGYGISNQTFTELWNGDVLDWELKKAQALARIYRVSQVPAIIVNGHYLTNGSLAGGSERLMRIMQYLMEKERTLPN